MGRPAIGNTSLFAEAATPTEREVTEAIAYGHRRTPLMSERARSTPAWPIRRQRSGPRNGGG